MTARRIAVVRLCFLIALVFLVYAVPAAQPASSQLSAATFENASPPEILPVDDAAIGESQALLLDIAIDVATRIPVEPHIKDRSRAQEQIVLGCIEMDLPNRALDYSQHIANWRQGYCYAELALYLAQHDRDNAAKELIRLAELWADESSDWRRDRILVKIAQALTWMGNKQSATTYASDVEQSEIGKLDKVEALLGGDGDFDSLMEQLETLARQQHFDVLRNTLKAFVALHERYYHEVSRREQVEKAMEASWGPMPVLIRIELLMDLAENALGYKDQNHALALINEAQDMLESHQWPLEHEIRMRARLHELRYLAGDRQQALDDAHETYSLFKANGQRIVNIWRAEALRPLAEAYQIMGQIEAAETVYWRALQEGVENPNSRPRAEDLSATTLSMAQHGFKPNGEFWQRINDIQQRLGEPW